MQDAHQLAEAFARHRSQLPWTWLTPEAAAVNGGASSGGNGGTDGTSHGAQNGATHANGKAADGSVAAASGGAPSNGTSNGHHAQTLSSTDVSHELAALKAISQEYNDARLVRVCRVARLSSEVCGLTERRDKLQADAGGQV
jgi:hypothetical protein